MLLFGLLTTPRAVGSEAQCHATQALMNSRYAAACGATHLDAQVARVDADMKAIAKLGVDHALALLVDSKLGEGVHYVPTIDF